MGALLGRTLGPYEVHSLIGHGEQAQVFLADQASLDRQVAIKVSNEALAGDSQVQARFKRAALAMTGLRHPAILRVHDAGVFEGRPYIVMDYAAGGSLAERLGREALSVASG